MTKSKISNTCPIAQASTARRVATGSSVGLVTAIGSATSAMIPRPLCAENYTNGPGGWEPLAVFPLWRFSLRPSTATLRGMIDKFVHSMADAVAGIADGSTILLGGFG